MTKKKGAAKATRSRKTASTATAKPSSTTKSKTKQIRAAKSSAPAAAVALTEYRRKRDFAKTAEPSGNSRTSGHARTAAKGASKAAHSVLRFVVQKHSATHLHFDLRLEIDGVMKSWAVPKGPSANPSVKRLAMQVEDHPIDYNSFEGTIPQGEYGGGTVMIWDTGTYTPETAPPGATKAQANLAAREAYERGDFKVTFSGKRLRGSYVVVRTRGFGSSSKVSWLLIKHRDEHAIGDDETDLVEKYTTSAVSKRTMDQIAKA